MVRLESVSFWQVDCCLMNATLHPLYDRWKAMIGRCEDAGRSDFKYYGGRGIRICDSWRKDFWQFAKDMLMPPTPSHELDRIDNAGDYEPGNCRWLTSLENKRNTSTVRLVTWQGETRTINDWARHLGMIQSTLLRRLNRLPVDKAMTTPLRHNSSHKPHQPTKNGEQ